MLSPAIEDYLKTIYKLESGGGAVATTALASEMRVTPASVTKMVKRLAELKLVDYASYKGVTLTPAGAKAALEIIRHHRLLELYLKEVMGYSWEQLHAEAEHLEHHISEAFEAKIDALLGHPTHDPHGHPIPTPEGEPPPPLPSESLAHCEAGARVVVHHLSDADPELLAYVEQIGLLPRVAVEILDKGRFGGPLRIRVGEAEHVIGEEVARGVYVSDEAA